MKEQLITLLDQHNEGVHNRGFRHYRTKYGSLEKAFADHWEEGNKQNPGVNYGQGILQDLMFRGDWPFSSLVHIVTPMERYVTATAIQWLGTNCGYAWLRGVLRADGMDIMAIQPRPPEPPPEPVVKFYTRKIIV